MPPKDSGQNKTNKASSQQSTLLRFLEKSDPAAPSSAGTSGASASALQAASMAVDDAASKNVDTNGASASSSQAVPMVEADIEDSASKTSKQSSQKKRPLTLEAKKTEINDIIKSQIEKKDFAHQSKRIIELLKQSLSHAKSTSTTHHTLLQHFLDYPEIKIAIQNGDKAALDAWYTYLNCFDLKIEHYTVIIQLILETKKRYPYKKDFFKATCDKLETDLHKIIEDGSSLQTPKEPEELFKARREKAIHFSVFLAKLHYDGFIFGNNIGLAQHFLLRFEDLQAQEEEEIADLTAKAQYAYIKGKMKFQGEFGEPNLTEALELFEIQLVAQQSVLDTLSEQEKLSVYLYIGKIYHIKYLAAKTETPEKLEALEKARDYYQKCGATEYLTILEPPPDAPAYPTVEPLQAEQIARYLAQKNFYPLILSATLSGDEGLFQQLAQFFEDQQELFLSEYHNICLMRDQNPAVLPLLERLYAHLTEGYWKEKTIDLSDKPIGSPEFSRFLEAQEKKEDRYFDGYFSEDSDIEYQMITDRCSEITELHVPDAVFSAIQTLQESTLRLIEERFRLTEDDFQIKPIKRKKEDSTREDYTTIMRDFMSEYKMIVDKCCKKHLPKSGDSVDIRLTNHQFMQKGKSSTESEGFSFTDPDSYALYFNRGIHFTRPYFNVFERKKLTSAVKNRQLLARPIYSLAVYKLAQIMPGDFSEYANAKLEIYELYLRTRLGNLKFAAYTQEQLRAFSEKMYPPTEKNYSDKRKRFTTLMSNKTDNKLVQVQNLYTNNYDMFNLFIRVESKEENAVFPNEHNPFVSLGDIESMAATNYASGNKVYGILDDEFRLRPRYEKQATGSLQPHYPHSGLVMLIEFPLRYMSRQLNHVPSLNREGSLTVQQNIFTELETTFVSALPSPPIYTKILKFPTFGEYSSIYAIRYGLTKELFECFKLMLSLSKKHSEENRLAVDILGRFLSTYHNLLMLGHAIRQTKDRPIKPIFQDEAGGFSCQYVESSRFNSFPNGKSRAAMITKGNTRIRRRKRTAHNAFETDPDIEAMTDATAEPEQKRSNVARGIFDSVAKRTIRDETMKEAEASDAPADDEMEEEDDDASTSSRISQARAAVFGTSHDEESSSEDSLSHVNLHEP